MAGTTNELLSPPCPKRARTEAQPGERPPGTLVVTSQVPRWVTASRVVHLKGFGEGKLAAAEHDEAILADLRHELGENGVLARDGDLFHSQSFTRVLDKLLQRAPIRAVAFFPTILREDFVNSWRDR